jgi:type I restriction enzyme, S subunit
VRMRIEDKWSHVKLGEIAQFRNGVNYNKSNFGKGIKVINVKDFQNRLKPVYSELEEINPAGVVREDHLLRENDILFVRSNGNRELIGRSLLITGASEPITHSAFTIRIRFTKTKTDPKFYIYLFRSNLMRDTLSAHGSGTNISNLNQDILSNLEVPLPPENTQRQIAAILSAYDDLIENNIRRIEILEEMARSLYREWFVNFRFPGHKKVRMVDSQIGRIPVGWEGRFGDLIDLHRESINPAQTPDEEFEHFSIPAFDNARNFSIELGSTILSGKYIIDDSCVLLSKLNPRIPRIWMPFPTSKHRAITSTEFLVIKPNFGIAREFIYEMCCSEEFLQRFASLALGTSTSHQRVKPNDFLQIPMPIPAVPLIERWAELSKPMLHLSECLRKRNQWLVKIKSLLLPKLISGEIDVSRFPEKEMEVTV